MDGVLYTLEINGVQYILQSSIIIKHIKFTKTTDTNPRTTRGKVRLVNRKAPIPSATFTGYIHDLAQFYTLYEHLSQINSRKSANNTFTVTVDGNVVLTKKLLVADFQGDWDESAKKKMDITGTMQFADEIT